MKTARAFLKETIRSARTLEFSLPIRRMPSLRTSAGPTFLGCLRRLETANLFFLASRSEGRTATDLARLFPTALQQKRFT